MYIENSLKNVVNLYETDESSIFDKTVAMLKFTRVLWGLPGRSPGGLGDAFERLGEGLDGKGADQGASQGAQERSKKRKKMFFEILEGQIHIFARFFDGRL